jgi:membrane associated rhomboid family serine protease
MPFLLTIKIIYYIIMLSFREDSMQKEVLLKLKYPFIFLGIMWVVFIINNLILQGALDSFAILPRHISHLPGIFFTPFLHANFNHILNNSIMFLILSLIISLYNEKIYLYTVFFVMIVSGLMTWAFSPTVYVIGASGIVFGLFGAVFGIAFYAKKVFFIIAGLLLAYLYGYSMYSGLIPQEGISFVGHVSGLIAGFISGISINKIFFKTKKTALV